MGSVFKEQTINFPCHFLKQDTKIQYDLEHNTALFIDRKQFHQPGWYTFSKAEQVSSSDLAKVGDNLLKKCVL